MLVPKVLSTLSLIRWLKSFWYSKSNYGWLIQTKENRRSRVGERDYRFHAAHLDRGLTIHEAVPGGFNRAGEGL